MSVTSTWGSVATAPATVSSWSAPTPTTRRSLWRSIRARTPSRTIRLSSAKKTVMIPPRVRSRSSRHSRARGGVRASEGDPLPTGGARPTVVRRSAPFCATAPAWRMRHATRDLVTSLSVDPLRGHLRAHARRLRHGVGHYDDPAARRVRDPEALREGPVPLREPPRRRGRGRRHPRPRPRYTGGGMIGATTLRLGALRHTFQAFSDGGPARRARGRRRLGPVLPDRGGRTGVPMPRKVRRPPFVQWSAPLAWTTLSLTVHADGRVESGSPARACSRATGSTTTTASSSEVGPHRLQELVGPLVRQALAVGRPGRRGLRHRRRERARARPVERGDARHRVPCGFGTSRRARPRRPRARRATRSSWSSTGCSASRSTASGWPSTAPARSSASAVLEGGRADMHALGRHTVQGCVRARGPARPLAARRAGRGAPPRGRGRASRCGSTSAACAGRPRPRAPLRPLRRVTPAAWRRRRATATTPDPGARRGHRATKGARLLEGQPFDGTILLSHLHWDHTHGCPSSRAATATARGDALVADQRPADARADVLARGMSPPYFPIGPDGLRGEWTFDGRAPRHLRGEGFTVDRPSCPTRVAAPSGTASATAARRSPTCPTTARPRSARATTASASTTRPRWPSPTASTPSCTTPSCSPTRSRPRPPSVTPRRSTPSGWRGGRRTSRRALPSQAERTDARARRARGTAGRRRRRARGLRGPGPGSSRRQLRRYCSRSASAGWSREARAAGRTARRCRRPARRRRGRRGRHGHNGDRDRTRRRREPAPHQVAHGDAERDAHDEPDEGDRGGLPAHRRRGLAAQETRALEERQLTPTSGNADEEEVHERRGAEEREQPSPRAGEVDRLAELTRLVGTVITSRWYA